jgi:hypothetical protein
VEHLKGVLLGWAPIFLANIKLGWAGLPEANTLAVWPTFLGVAREIGTTPK